MIVNNISRGDVMEIERYVNGTKIKTKKLPKMVIKNLAIVQLLLDLQQRTNKEDNDTKMCD